MTYIDLARKNKEVSPESWEQLYSFLVVQKIRKKYSVNDELSVMRKKDTRPHEFRAYDEYVERCKEEAKAEMGWTE